MLLSGFLLAVAGFVTHVTTVQAYNSDAECFDPSRGDNCSESDEACPVLPVCLCAAGFQLNPTTNVCEPKPRPSFDMQGNPLELSNNHNFGDSLKKKVDSITRDANELKQYLSSRYEDLNKPKIPSDPCNPSNKSRDRKRCHKSKGHSKKSKKQFDKTKSRPAAVEIRVFLEGADSDEMSTNKPPRVTHNEDMNKMKRPIMPMPHLMFVPSQYYESLGIQNPTQGMFPMPFAPPPMMLQSKPKSSNATATAQKSTNTTDKDKPAATQPSPSTAPETEKPKETEKPIETEKPTETATGSERRNLGRNYYPIRGTQRRRDQQMETQRMDRIDNTPGLRTTNKHIEPFYPDRYGGNEGYVNKFNPDVRSLQNENTGLPEGDIDGLRNNLRGRKQDDNNEENQALMHQNLVSVNNYEDYVPVWPKQLKVEKDDAVGYVVENVRLPNTFNRIRPRPQPSYREDNYFDVNENNIDEQIRSLVRKVYLRGKRQKYANNQITDNNVNVEKAYSPSLIKLQNIINEIAASDIEVLNEPEIFDKIIISQQKTLVESPNERMINRTSTLSVLDENIPSVRTKINDEAVKNISRMPYVSSFVYKVLTPGSSVDRMNATHKIEYTIKDKLLQIPATSQHEDQNTFNDEIVHQIELEVLGQTQNVIQNSVINPNITNITHTNNVDNEKHLKEPLIKANLEKSNLKNGNISKNLDDHIIKAIMDYYKTDTPTAMNNYTNTEVHNATVVREPVLNSLEMNNDKVTYILNPSYLPKNV